MVKTLQEKRPVDYFNPNTVMYLTGDCNYSRLHLAGGQVKLSARTLKWFALQWPEFLRPHKRALINPAYIDRLQVGQTMRVTSYIIMQDEAQLPVSRRRLSSLVSQVGETYSI